VPLNAIAWSLWGLSFVAGVPLLFWWLPALTVAAVLLGIGGATVHVRGFITQLEQREAKAFELGQASVRMLHR
jgi:hypothetical protein